MYVNVFGADSIDNKKTFISLVTDVKPRAVGIQNVLSDVLCVVLLVKFLIFSVITFS